MHFKCRGTHRLVLSQAHDIDFLDHLVMAECLKEALLLRTGGALESLRTQQEENWFLQG